MRPCIQLQRLFHQKKLLSIKSFGFPAPQASELYSETLAEIGGIAYFEYFVLYRDGATKLSRNLANQRHLLVVSNIIEFFSPKGISFATQFSATPKHKLL